VYVYFRYLDDEKVMVVLNKNTEPHTLALERFEEVLGDAVRGVDVIRGGTYDLTSAIELAPRTALVLQVE
ncbi:MAG: cyclomaltodextrinase C-terminal domain-containing protein, partial [Rhodospirillaceae bacterium]|nr:cyclomaltodextrinase C-terminal domain-containing protein [Rhodospirillaceae bacterium]